MAVTRKTEKDGRKTVFILKSVLDVETAIDAYTIESAYAEFMEDRKGRIKEGYYADVVLLDRDIFYSRSYGDQRYTACHDHGRRQDSI